MEEILRGYHVNPPTWFYLSLLLILAVFYKFGRIWSVRNFDLALLLSLAPGLLFVQANPETFNGGGNQRAQIKITTGVHATGDRKIEVLNGDVKIEIRDKNGKEIELTHTRKVVVQAKTEEYKGADLDDLRKKHPEAAELYVKYAPGKGSPFGYCWLFAISGLLLARLVFDAALTRRPRLEQNLNPAGMLFLCASALLFQTTKIMTEQPDVTALNTVRGADELLKRQDASGTEPTDPKSESGPAGRLLATTVVPLTGGTEIVAARAMAILSHLAVILGLIAVGRWHFSDTYLGLAMATLYLLLPPTAYDVSKVNHLLPAALIVWAVAAHGRPMVAGMLLGLACGTMFFPIFLLPIWVAFYWKRGSLKFGLALILTGAVLLGSLMLTSVDTMSFKRQTLGSIDWSVLKFQANGGVGFWSLYDPAFRIPVFATFLVLLTALSIWPFKKNLEHLIAHSAAVVVATQFWYPHQGGVYVLWYLPLMLIVTFRPRLGHLPPDDKAPAAKLAVSGGSSVLRNDLLAGASRTQMMR